MSVLFKASLINWTKLHQSLPFKLIKVYHSLHLRCQRLYLFKTEYCDTKKKPGLFSCKSHKEHRQILSINPGFTIWISFTFNFSLHLSRQRDNHWTKRFCNSQIKIESIKTDAMVKTYRMFINNWKKLNRNKTRILYYNYKFDHTNTSTL